MGKYCRIKHYNFNTADTKITFCKDEEGCDCFYLGNGYSELLIFNGNMVENDHLYAHEFSELAILGAIRKCTKKWHGQNVKFKYFAKTSVAHLINCYSIPNKRCLCPDKEMHKVYKQVCYKLSKEELKVRQEVGIDW